MFYSSEFPNLNENLRQKRESKIIRFGRNGLRGNEQYYFCGNSHYLIKWSILELMAPKVVYLKFKYAFCFLFFSTRKFKIVFVVMT